MGRRVVDLTGRRFGRLTAIAHRASTLRKQAMWLCACDCGNEALVPSRHLQNGGTSSCGCYRRDVRRSRPLKSLESRFWQKVDIPPDPDFCWNWNAATSCGYGVFGRGKRGDGNIGAHVYSYLLFNEFIPEGEEVCHSCNNRRCVNPYHLYAGTRKDNMEQAQRQGRLKQPYRPWSAERRAAHEARKLAA